MYHKYMMDGIASSVSQYELYRNRAYRYTPDGQFSK